MLETFRRGLLVLALVLGACNSDPPDLASCTPGATYPCLCLYAIQQACPRAQPPDCVCDAGTRVDATGQVTSDAGTDAGGP